MARAVSGAGGQEPCPLCGKARVIPLPWKRKTKKLNSSAYSTTSEQKVSKKVRHLVASTQGCWGSHEVGGECAKGFAIGIVLMLSHLPLVFTL